MLEATDIFAGANLPIELGAARLEVVDLPPVTLVAPFKGQAMAVADALQSELGMILPPAGQCRVSERANAYWRGPSQWLVFGDLALARLLEGMALVVDMSDALGKLKISGGVQPVLSRLVEVDLERMLPGQVAHTSMAGIPLTLIAQDGAFEVMMPRSMAASAVSRLEGAMRSQAARALLA